jgi:hypothetical protein
VLVGDLMLAEVLQGLRHERHGRQCGGHAATLSNQVAHRSIARIAKASPRSTTATSARKGINIRKTIDP